MKRFFSLALILLASCTPGGVTPLGGSGANPQNVVTVSVSLSAFGLTQTPAGPALGYSPAIVTVPVGSGIRFVNTDNTTHTASAVPGSVFPASSPLQFTATTPSSANAVSSGTWSSGALQAGTSSQVFLVDRPGTYLFGCFYHYSGKMRGEIVAQ
ncbi:MAG TPA: plastocyanin/azurin family copper-binding protein [Candidatus Baltobacteraceae bacterium]|jgi:plastocyanin|nr:plastocyanin/azurin family copper-binding protein [Candidatus Baltobacteraceae bacterium]